MFRQPLAVRRSGRAEAQREKFCKVVASTPELHSYTAGLPSSPGPPLRGCLGQRSGLVLPPPRGGVVCGSYRRNYSAVEVSEIASRRWWCLRSLFPLRKHVTSKVARRHRHILSQRERERERERETQAVNTFIMVSGKKGLRQLRTSLPSSPPLGCTRAFTVIPLSVKRTLLRRRIRLER